MMARTTSFPRVKAGCAAPRLVSPMRMRCIKGGFSVSTMEPCALQGAFSHLHENRGAAVLTSPHTDPEYHRLTMSG